MISADGNWVAYWSSSDNLVAGQIPGPAFSDLFLYERATGTNRLVSHVAGSAVTEAGMDPSSRPSLSADAGYVAFRSDATNLVVGQIDGAGTDDVFVYERASDTNVLVSHIPASATTTTGASSVDPTISADGSSVAFRSNATNLVAGQNDTNGDFDVFLFHRPSGRVSLVSHVAGSATTTGATIGAFEARSEGSAPMAGT